MTRAEGGDVPVAPDPVGEFVDRLETFVRSIVLDSTSDDVADRAHFHEARDALYELLASSDA